MIGRLSWVLVALAGLALLAGCGKSEQKQYTSNMKAISKQLEKEQQQVTADTRAASLSEKATRATRLQSVFNRLAKRYGEVKPPSKVKDLHQRLTAYIRGFADSLTPYIQAANSGDPKRFQAIARAFSGQVGSFQAQLATLNNDYCSRGYKLN